MAVRTDREAGAEVARALQAVEDPELPVSIVDLGMVRAVTVSAGAAVVELVPTFLACPALWLVESEVRERATGVPGVTGCQVIWRPGGWSGADVTKAGRADLARVGLVVPDDDGTVCCPFCGSAEVAATSAFGSAVCRSAAFCATCRTPVEVLKTKAPAGAAPGPAGAAANAPGPAQPVELRLIRRDAPAATAGAPGDGEPAEAAGAVGTWSAGALMPWMNKS
jgi:ring-1,2-phenylacetyl-CoA epoxidase subunit PaaD